MKLEDIKKIAVIGSGAMGHGIAQVCIQAGMAVVMRDIKQVFDPNHILNPGKMFPQPPSIPPYQGGGDHSSPDKGRPGGVGFYSAALRGFEPRFLR